MLATSPAPLPFWRLLAYAAPALPLAVLTLPFAIVVPNHYAATLGLSLASVGQVLLLVRLFDAISDPVVGVLADRIRPVFGRRRTWFAASVPITVAATWLVFVPPPDAGVLWLLVFGTLLTLGMTLSLIPYWAWGAELATGYADRNRISAVREAVVVVGTLAATSTPALVQATGWGGPGDALLALAVLVAVALPITALAALRLVPEPVDYSRDRLDLKASWAHLRANRPFLILLSAFVLNGFANGLPATLFLFFVGQVLAVPDQAGLVLFVYFLSGVAGVPLWLALSRRFGKHRTWCVAMIGASAVFATVPLLGPGDLTPFLVVCVLTGLALGADLVLPPSIQADVIDLDTAKSGEQRTGTYVAAWGLATKVALALAVGVSFPLLDWAGFDATGATTSEGGLLMLTVLYAAVPVAMKLAAIRLMWSFPLDAAEQARLRAAIEAAAVTSNR
ncbi:MFS transporter [Chthonobacter rhizosphaerae]|uniref:MFS transporter n=1 Tax=Chthonobacter rhizosphaerae TaxID=2735553 RepID=UPI0015EE79A6|nr:MFS transporter [Chthonobacter rhizosphaerae]